MFCLLSVLLLGDDMLIFHVNALIFNTSTREFETRTFTVQARTQEDAETQAFAILSQDGIPLESVCSLVASVN